MKQTLLRQTFRFLMFHWLLQKSVTIYVFYDSLDNLLRITKICEISTKIYKAGFEEGGSHKRGLYNFLYFCEIFLQTFINIPISFHKTYLLLDVNLLFHSILACS